VRDVFFAPTIDIEPVISQNKTPEAFIASGVFACADPAQNHTKDFRLFQYPAAEGQGRRAVCHKKHLKA
jgi:hypothetical protein